MVKCVFLPSPGRRRSWRREDTGGERVIPQTVQAWQRRPEPPVWVWPGSAATGDRENRQGRETTTKMFRRCFVLFFLETFFNHLQTNTNTWRRTHEGVRERDNCGADVQFQRRQVTQAQHSSLKGVTAVWQRLFLRVSMATDNSRSLQDGYTQLASWFRTQSEWDRNNLESFELSTRPKHQEPHWCWICVEKSMFVHKRTSAGCVRVFLSWKIRLKPEQSCEQGIFTEKNLKS